MLIGVFENAELHRFTIIKIFIIFFMHLVKLQCVTGDLCGDAKGCGDATFTERYNFDFSRQLRIDLILVKETLIQYRFKRQAYIRQKFYSSELSGVVLRNFVLLNVKKQMK